MKGGSILIVDDDPQLRRALRGMGDASHDWASIVAYAAFDHMWPSTLTSASQ